MRLSFQFFFSILKLMSQLPYLDQTTLEAFHDYPLLIDELEQALAQSKIQYPLRQHYSYQDANALLVMPSWQDDRDIGIKLVTVTPANQERGLPSIQGVVVYFDANTGAPLAVLDAATVTRKRTAAASALASRLLSRADSSTLLLLGTGALAPELIRAHAAVRPIEQVCVWGRSLAKAQRIQAMFASAAYEVEAVATYAQVAPTADIISTATMADDPLLNEVHLKDGQHLDLVGSYLPSMREADDTVIAKTKIYVDNQPGAEKESGDILQPLNNGVITKEDIRGTLAELCQKEAPARQYEQEITLFKSVGFALEDLVAARFYYQRYLHS